jgi:hypothetical protein
MGTLRGRPRLRPVLDPLLDALPATLQEGENMAEPGQEDAGVAVAVACELLN